MAWTVETLNNVVDAEIEELPADMRARFVHISGLIEEFGLDRVREPHVKHVRGPLWEMRMKGRDGFRELSTSLWPGDVSWWSASSSRRRGRHRTARSSWP
jgi:hypothetical protein